MYIGIFCTCETHVFPPEMTIINTPITYRTREECVQALWESILDNFVADVDIMIQYANWNVLDDRLRQKFINVLDDDKEDEDSDEEKKCDDDEKKEDTVVNNNPENKKQCLKQIQLNLDELSRVAECFFGEDLMCKIKIVNV